MLNISKISQLDLSAFTLTRGAGAASVVAGICAGVIVFQVVDSGHHTHILLNIAKNGLN